MTMSIPEVVVKDGSRRIPVIGMGTATYPWPAPEVLRSAVLDAILLGYRHFDTASVYNTERPLGEAIAEALRRGLVRSRDELFVTSKLWCTDAHPDRVLPALRQSLRKLQLEYLDLYLIHWPVSLKPTEVQFTFEATRSIGVSNFSCKKLEQVLAVAKIPPAVNQVEMHPVWQQKKLMEFCQKKGIQVTAYSPLGGNETPWGNSNVMDCEVLKEIATARGKTLPQVSLRWIYQQGAGVIVKSFKPERMKENIDIFDWKLSDEDLQKISQIPQCRGCLGDAFVSADGPFESLNDLWDGEI